MHNHFFPSLFPTDDKQPRFRRLVEAFSNPITGVYLLFYQATFPVFSTFNLLLQREKSPIFLLHDEVNWEGWDTVCKYDVLSLFLFY